MEISKDDESLEFVTSDGKICFDNNGTRQGSCLKESECCEDDDLGDDEWCTDENKPTCCLSQDSCLREI